MGGETGAETNLLRKEVAELKEQLARRLKNEKRYDETLIAKDTQIQELLDYKKQWNHAKFARLEDLIEVLEKEKAALKAKYKHKAIVKTESVRAELSKEPITG